MNLTSPLWTLKGLHVLIVDDYAQMRTMLREMLVACGADQIESVKNGEEAIEAMARQKPDIVLCDYGLGEGKDGQQVLEEAREHDFLPCSSIFVLVTAENTMSMVMGAVEHEPDAYLTKPFTRDVLQSRLRRIQQKKMHFAGIATAMERREYRKAATLCDHGISDQPAYRHDLLRIKADALRRLGDHLACESLYRSVLAERELPWALYGLGLALQAQQKFEDSVEALQQALAIKPDFVAAWDALAQVQQDMGQPAACEESLRRAVALSPKNLRRQQRLGDAAINNGHLDVAEQAFRTAVREGRHSLFGGPENLAGLAQVHIHNGDSRKAQQALGRMQSNYQGAEGQTQLQMAVLQASLHQQLGNEAASKEAVAKAAGLMDAYGDTLKRADMMSLAETCMAQGNQELGSELVQKVVRANHEDQAMLQRAQALFDQAGLSERGHDLIAKERKAVVKLNNNAVQLVREGQLREGVTMLLQAAQAMPDNVTINLNAAQCVLQMIQQEGGNWRLLRQAQQLLAGVSAKASGDKRYRDLLKLSQSLEQSLSDAA